MTESLFRVRKSHSLKDQKIIKRMSRAASFESNVSALTKRHRDSVYDPNRALKNMTKSIEEENKLRQIDI